MSPRRLTLIVIATEGALAAGAATAASLLELDLAWGSPVRDVAVGLAAAALLAALNYAVLTSAPDGWLVRGVRAVYHDLVVPAFGRLDLASIVIIGVAAGVGEEWLFRGVLQPLVGLVPASLAFGAVHVGGRAMLPFGLWAAVMGLILGGLATATGGLIAPMVAHGAYDALALAYVRHDAARLSSAAPGTS